MGFNSDPDAPLLGDHIDLRAMAEDRARERPYRSSPAEAVGGLDGLAESVREERGLPAGRRRVSPEELQAARVRADIRDRLGIPDGAA